jgi:succinate dehydrogenase / fumarate reductase, iron-sulfur subunit
VIDMSTTDTGRTETAASEPAAMQVTAPGGAGPKRTRSFEIWRGTAEGGEMVTYETEVSEGMVVLDAVHQIQAEQANDLAVRWNCKAGKCGSCSAEINGKPRLMCMTRLGEVPDEPVRSRSRRCAPSRFSATSSRTSRGTTRSTAASPHSAEAARLRGRGLADVPVRSRPAAGDAEVHRVLPLPGRLPRPPVAREARRVRRPRLPRARGRVRDAPARHRDRTTYLKDEGGIGYCNITKCCTEVCPEHITITDNAIIPLKERVVDRHYDPITKLEKVGDEPAEPADGES